MSNFNCTACGLCCKRVGKTVGMAQKSLREGNRSAIMIEAAAFPYSYDEKGVCEMLGEDNQCKIYDRRPLICQVENFGKTFHPNLSQEAWFKLNEQGCKDLQDADKRNTL